MKKISPLHGIQAACIVTLLLCLLLFATQTGAIQPAYRPLPKTTPAVLRLTPMPATYTRIDAFHQPVRDHRPPPTYTPLPKVTRAFPTPTPTVDLVMTEIAKGAAMGILVLPLGAETALPAGATPLPTITLSLDAFPICNPNYARVCLPANLDRVWCFDMAERNILVIGEDDLQIDDDGNGIACEENDR